MNFMRIVFETSCCGIRFSSADLRSRLISLKLECQSTAFNDLQSPFKSVVAIAIINAMSIARQNIGHCADRHVASDGKLVLSVSMWFPKMQPEVITAVRVH